MVTTIHFQLIRLVFIQFQTKMGEKVPFFLQIFFTGKPGLPEQGFTTLIPAMSENLIVML